MGNTRGSSILMGMVIMTVIVILGTVAYRRVLDGRRWAKTVEDSLNYRRIGGSIQLALARRDICPVFLSAVKIPPSTPQGTKIALSRLSLGSTPLIYKTGTTPSAGYEVNQLYLKVDPSEPILDVVELNSFAVPPVDIAMKIYSTVLEYDGIVQASGSMERQARGLRSHFVEVGALPTGEIIHCSSRPQYLGGLMNVTCGENRFVTEIDDGVPSCN